MITTQGNLVLIGLNTDSASLFWNGAKVPGVVEIKADWEVDDHRLKIKVNLPLENYAALIADGIIVKEMK